MNEQQAREVLLLQAFESVPDDHPQWTPEDRRWASRAALQSVGESASREAFVVERARLALQRLGPRDAGVRRLHAGTPLGPAAVAVLALGLGALVGLVSDRLVAGSYFNLLALPFWGLLAWNLAAYAWRLMATLRGAGHDGPARRAVAALWRRWALRVGSGSPLAGFATRWAGLAAGLSGARAAALLHLVAAGLAMGLIAGMLLRGLVFDYRAGWATTLLDVGAVHAFVTTALAPAIALTGALTGTLASQGAPDLAAFEALRVWPERTPVASAAPWMGWMSMQLLIVVLLPRLALAAWEGLRAWRLSRRLPLALDGPYFDRLRPPVAPRILWVLPHAQAPSPQAVLGLRALLAAVWGETLPLQVAAPLAYGDEDRPPTPPSGARPLMLVDLATTPEPDVHRRLLDALASASAAAPLLVVDEAGFVRRFGPGARLDERRAAWRALAHEAGVGFVVADLESGDPAAAGAALRAVLEAVA